MASKSGGERNREHNARGTPEGKGGGGARGNADRGGGGSDNRGNNPGNPNAAGYLNYDNQTTTMPNGQRVPVGKMRTDYVDYTNPSIADKIGGFFAGFGGFDEKNPFSDKDYGLPDSAGNPTAGQGARWGWDPVQGAVTLGGLLGGPIGSAVSGAYRVGKFLGYEPPTIDMGPSVFGGAPSSGAGQASNSGGMFGGGGNPSNPQDNRGAGGGLLQPTTQPGVTPLAPVAPAAQPAAQQAKERQKRMYALNGVNIPGPTPYSFTGAKWL